MPQAVPNPPLAPAELARHKALCDILFGAADGETYARIAGRALGGFTLCVVGLGGASPCLAEALAWIAGLPQCRDAAVFAASPGRIAMLWEHPETGDGATARPGRFGWFLPAARLKFGPDASVAAETARGAGADELRECFQECDRALAEGLPAGDGRPSAYGAARGVSPALGKAVDYIADHYAEPITLNDVAEHAYVSSCYISRLFMRELGVSFVDYLTAMRLERAKRLLRSTDLKVFEIAELAGISDAHYFARLFKRNTGTSPTGYRISSIL